MTGNERRWFERVSVEGGAAVMSFGYLGIVYQLEDLSLGGARLRGPMPPPATVFDLLLRVGNRYTTHRAHRVWGGLDDSVGIEFEVVHAGSRLEWETGEEEASVPEAALL
jgi:hypothetical protein